VSFTRSTRCRSSCLNSSANPNKGRALHRDARFKCDAGGGGLRHLRIGMWWCRAAPIARASDMAHRGPCLSGRGGLLPMLTVPYSPWVVFSAWCSCRWAPLAALADVLALPPNHVRGGRIGGGHRPGELVRQPRRVHGTYMTGWLKDLTGDFHIALPVASICMAGAGLACWPWRRCRRRDAQSTPATMRA